MSNNQQGSFEKSINELGLQQKSDGQFEFIMPRVDKTTVGSTLEALQHILDATGKLGKGKAGIPKHVAAIAVRNIAGQIAYVALDQLLDTTLADMLSAFADVDYKAAIRALNDAKNDPSPDGKNRNRSEARGCLRQAYEKYDSAIQKLKKKLLNEFGWYSAEIYELHKKAVNMALIIALISRELEEESTAVTWANNAKTHFQKQMFLRFMVLGHKISHQEQEKFDRFDQFYETLIRPRSVVVSG
jgi:hypothetical protein